MEEIKKYWILIKNFLSNKKVQNIIALVLFLAVLVLGAYIRLQPLPNLIDHTTGDYTPLALDPYYFLRVSETLLETGGDLSQIDNMRYQGLNPSWTKEILPQSTVLLYKVLKTISPNMTLNLANVLNPVVFFVIGLIIFALLIWLLSRNKWIALISSFILAIIPPYLYRTLAGFSDHESIGMVGIFLALISFAYGLFYLDKKKIASLKLGLIGLIAGFFTMFAIVGWGGGGKFLFMIFPLAFFIRWLTKKDKIFRNNLSFYTSWILGIFVGALIFGYSFEGILRAYMISLSGILTFFVLGYMIIEIFLIKYKVIPKKIKKYEKLISLGGVLFFGAIFYQIFIGHFFLMFFNLLKSIIYPFGTGRVGLTVAENAQPYLNDLIGQIGKFLFYTFLFGCLIVGIKISQGIKNKKLRPLFSASFFIFILGILFSRISSNSIFNGVNFISKAFFFLSFLFVAVSSIYIYFKSDWEVDTRWLFIVAWMIPMLLSVRSAVRVFFAIVPFISFLYILTIFEVGAYAKKNKEEFMKFLTWIIFIILIIGLIFTSFSYYKTVNAQAKGQHPSYNSQWQDAMAWVRENTNSGSVFLHWWDYGYWVQTGGDRPTVTDGGHFNGYWDHLVGRYVLTTPYPETAKSFMKTHNVSYLLIDPTDLGKYAAYSSIGDDAEVSDRSSYLVTFVSEAKEIKETKDSIIRFYRGGIHLDGDLIYENEEDYLFLPKGKAVLGGLFVEKFSNGSYSQPTGVYIYNNKQETLPIRFLYVQGKLIDFNEGVNSTVYIYPRIISDSQGQKMDLEGASIYLSEKTKDSLFAKLYLMDDPLKEYPELNLSYSKTNYPYPFYYNGFQGSIKIWKVNEMPNILEREEFLRTSGEYGEFDNLTFTK